VRKENKEVDFVRRKMNDCYFLRELSCLDGAFLPYQLPVYIGPQTQAIHRSAFTKQRQDNIQYLYVLRVLIDFSCTV